jgi:hypothetical protein
MPCFKLIKPKAQAYIRHNTELANQSFRDYNPNKMAVHTALTKVQRLDKSKEGDVG